MFKSAKSTIRCLDNSYSAHRTLYFDRFGTPHRISDVNSANDQLAIYTLLDIAGQLWVDHMARD